MRCVAVAALVLALLAPGSVFAKPRKPTPTHTFTATAYCQKGETASGARARSGIAAADPRILPLGSTVRIADPRARGTYTIQDTGVKGRRIDLFMPSCRDARRFGKRRVQVQVVRLASADGRARREAR